MSTSITVMIRSPRRLDWGEIQMSATITAISPRTLFSRGGQEITYTRTNFKFTKTMDGRDHLYTTNIYSEGTIELSEADVSVPAGCSVTIRR